jgi:hypothetical protein
VNGADMLQACVRALTEIQKLASERLGEDEEAVDRLDTINDKTHDLLYELRRWGGIEIEE